MQEIKHLHDLLDIDVFSVNKVLSVLPSLSVLSISALTGGLL